MLAQWLARWARPDVSKAGSEPKEMPLPVSSPRRGEISASDPRRWADPLLSQAVRGDWTQIPNLASAGGSDELGGLPISVSRWPGPGTVPTARATSRSGSSPAPRVLHLCPAFSSARLEHHGVLRSESRSLDDDIPRRRPSAARAPSPGVGGRLVSKRGEQSRAHPASASLSQRGQTVPQSYEHICCIRLIAVPFLSWPRSLAQSHEV